MKSDVPGKSEGEVRCPSSMFHGRFEKLISFLVN